MDTVVLLLATLVLLFAASVAALLAWSGTRAPIAFLAFAVLAAGSGGTLWLTLAEHDKLLSEPEVVLAEASDPTRPPEEPADATPPPAVTAAVPEPTPFVPEPTPFVPEPTPIVADTGEEAPAAGGFVLEPASAAEFGAPTAFAIGDDGELYVGHSTGIAVLRDLTGDGFYETSTHFGLDSGWVFGLDYHEGYLYAAVAGRALRLADVNGDDSADAILVLTEGLPHNQYGGHSNSGLAVGPDGLLYMTVGGTSDHGPELEPLGGTIVTIPLAGGEPAIYARGFRNPYDLDFCPDGRLYASDNGPDQLVEGGVAVRPWDEVNHVLPGGDYGYPTYYGPAPPASGTISPIARLAPSAGVTGIVCYSGAAYPAEYRGDLFVTLWGTFTYPIESGRRVMHVELAETADGPAGLAVQFMGGFGHPIDILEDAQGHLLVLDHEAGRVFRIRYSGPPGG